MAYALVIFLLISIIIFDKRQQINLNMKHKKRIKDYQNKNELSDSELNLFKETMSVAKGQIIEWELVVDGSKILKKKQEIIIGIKSAQEIFKELMEHPKEMTELHDFLYTKLPGVLSASKSFIAIEEADISTDEIKQSLASILSTIIMVSESITDDYEEIIAEDLDEINVTKQLVGKKYEE